LSASSQLVSRFQFLRQVNFESLQVYRLEPPRIFVLVGMLSFESLWWALLPPVLYFGIHLVEGETLTPMLLARRFTLNPVLLIILSLGFWFWMWGR
jgi:hypothetical protein